MSSDLITTWLSDATLVIELLPKNLRDAAVAQRLQQEMVSAVVSSDPQHVVIDFSAVEMIGSIAFLAFLAVKRQGRVSRVVIGSLRPIVRESFEVCRLVRSESQPAAPFELAESVADAIGLLEKP